MKSARPHRKAVKRVALTPAQKREVKKLVSHVSELKWSDLGFLGLTVSTTPTVSALTLILKGKVPHSVLVTVSMWITSN